MSFAGPIVSDEIAFEQLLWQTLQQLHDLDAPFHRWDQSVSSDADHADFSFSVGGVAFFVVGLHAASSRLTRRFAWPTLVMNPHRQFEILRATGMFPRFQEVIRHGDEELQGAINPTLAEHGQKSEAMQYSGRYVEPGWQCPFRARQRRCDHAGERQVDMMIRQRLAPQSGTAFVLRRGDTLRIIDPVGEQVTDLVAYGRDDRAEWLSSGRTLDYNNTIYLTTGHALYSNRSRVMLTIVADTVGRHDFLYTPCSPETFSIIYKTEGHHPSCLANLASSLRHFDIGPDAIPTTFNVFMNIDVLPSGELKIGTPRSRAGDFVALRAELDLIIGLTACSADMSNNYAFKPIDFEVDIGIDG